MNDTLCEQVLKRRQSGREKMTNAGILLLGILGILISILFLGILSSIAVSLILVIEYFVLIPRRNVEVEYSFYEGVLEIFYIYNKEKRKKKLELDIRNAEAIVATESSEIQAYRLQKKLDYSSGTDQNKTYSVITRIGNDLTQVLIEPNEQMLRFMERSIRLRM